MGEKAGTSWKVIRITGDERMEKEDVIAEEFALTIRLDGEEFATLVCTPSDLTDLVIGFLASEGVIRRMEDIKEWTLDEERGFAYVNLLNPQSTSKDFYSKRIIGSCCGKSRQFYFHNDARTAKTISGGVNLTVEQCFTFMRDLQAGSSAFHLTGGVHNAALCDAAGLNVTRTDIGRHNALDKLFGYSIRNRIAAKQHVIAFSGRISSEVVLKTAKIGCPILLSKSAPTDLALQLAEDLGITCVGFIRGDSLNIYTHAERILF